MEIHSTNSIKIKEFVAHYIRCIVIDIDDSNSDIAEKIINRYKLVHKLEFISDELREMLYKATLEHIKSIEDRSLKAVDNIHSEVVLDILSDLIKAEDKHIMFRMCNKKKFIRWYINSLIRTLFKMK